MSDLLNKAKFKARRGLNELDKIFVPFVEKRFLSLDNSQVNQLFELLEIDDVSLADIIIYKKTDYPIELREIFEEIFDYSFDDIDDYGERLTGYLNECKKVLRMN